MSDTINMQPLAEAARRIAQAKRIAVFTGAGMSQESGIATDSSPHSRYSFTTHALHFAVESAPHRLEMQ